MEQHFTNERVITKLYTLGVRPSHVEGDKTSMLIVLLECINRAFYVFHHSTLLSIKYKK